MKSTLEWSNQGRLSYLQQLAWLSDHWNDEIVQNFIKKVSEFEERVKEFPKHGNYDSKTKTYKVVIHRNVSIYYEYFNEKVFILRVWDNRMDPRDLVM